jgi:hypothetical protein
MVELGIQVFPMLLGLLTLSDVDIDPNHPLRVATNTVLNETARINPPNLATGTNNAIICIVFTLAIAESPTPEHV